MAARMTASELQDFLVAALARRHGGSQRPWRLAVGAVRVHDAGTHPHCNWSLDPTGETARVAAIERLLDEVRLTHPIVTAG
jgi:hypothetical protein